MIVWTQSLNAPLKATMGDHLFEMLQVFETGDFLILFNRGLHGIFYIDEYNIYQQ